MSKQLVENCKRSCAHKVPSIFSSGHWTWRFHNKSTENLNHPQGHVTPKWLSQSGRNSNVWDFMPVLVTSKFVEDSIKNEQGSLETPFSPYKSMGNFSDAQGHLTVGSSPIWPKFELVRDFMPILITCKFEKDLIQNNREKVETSEFSPLYVNVNRRFLLPWKPEFWSNLSQNLMQPFPHHNDTSYKIWSIGQLASEIFKFHLNYDRMTERLKDRENPV